ncbi:MAG: hypothetical protein PGN22_02755 [Agrobacterium cavarae]
MKTTRRNFLGGVAVSTLPMSSATGGAVSPVQMTAHERAELHWKAFAEAMDEITAEYDGWLVNGGSRLSMRTGERHHHRSQNSIRMMPEQINSTVVNIERHSPLSMNWDKP